MLRSVLVGVLMIVGLIFAERTEVVKPVHEFVVNGIHTYATEDFINTYRGDVAMCDSTIKLMVSTMSPTGIFFDSITFDICSVVKNNVTYMKFNMFCKMPATLDKAVIGSQGDKSEVLMASGAATFGQTVDAIYFNNNELVRKVRMAIMLGRFCKDQPDLARQYFINRGKSGIQADSTVNYYTKLLDRCVMSVEFGLCSHDWTVKYSIDLIDLLYKRYLQQFMKESN